MRRVRIADVTSEPSTWNPLASTSGQPFRYIDISSIDAAEKKIANASTIARSEAPSRARQLVRSDDVLVSTVRPNLNAVALVPSELDGATASTGLTVLRPNVAQVDPMFLYHWVRSPQFVREMTARATGASYPAVTERIIRDSTLRLPPLAEQRRITAVFDRAHAVLRRRRKSLSLAEQLPHSVFLAMFGNMMRHDDKQNLPRGWRVLSVSELAESSRYACAGGPFGSSLTRADYVSDPGVPVIRGANLVSETGRFHDDDFVFVSEKKAKELARNIAKPGDVVFTQRGTLGQVAEIPLSAKYPAYVVSQSQMKVSLNKGIADPQYIVHFFLSARGRSEIASRTMATGIPHINLAVLRGLPVVLPPLAAQRRFAAIVQGQYELQQVLENALQETEGLLSSLAHNTFS